MGNTLAPEANESSDALAAAPGKRLAWRDAFFRYVPAFGVLRSYTWRDLGADTLAGLTVATVAVPQAMAYAMIAGIPPQYGLYTAVVMTLVGALFDSSRQLINGPTNAISIALLSAVAYLPAGEERISAAIFLALLIGLFQVGITLLRLGDLTRYVSHGVIVGFTLGAGVLLALGQWQNLVGLRPQGDPHDHFLLRFWWTLTGSAPDGWTAAVGFGTVGVVLLLRLAKSVLPERHRLLVPEFLLAVIAVSAVVWAWDLEHRGVAVIGAIPPALPPPTVPEVRWEFVRELSGSALAIAVLGLLEAIAMAKAIAAHTRQRLDINQQCLSEGLANVAGSFFQCIPGSGSLTRSAINQQAGAVSQWSGVISAGAVALTVVLLAPLAYYIPRAALAGILLLSAWRMVDKRQLAYHLRATRFDAVVVLATAFAAVAISVEFCILIGVFLSFVLYVPRAARLELTELTVTPERVIRERTECDEPCERILIYNLEGELFFGSAPDLERHLDAVRARANDRTRVVVLRLRRARNADAVCLAVLEDFLRDMQARGVLVLLCGLRPDLHQVLRATGVEALVGPEHVFPERNQSPTSSTLDAIRHAYQTLRYNYCDLCPQRQITGPEQKSWYYMI